MIHKDAPLTQIFKMDFIILSSVKLTAVFFDFSLHIFVVLFLHCPCVVVNSIQRDGEGTNK